MKKYRKTKALSIICLITNKNKYTRCFCYEYINTACYLLNLSDRAPYKIDVTTINHNNISENLEIHYVSKDKFNIGITEIKSPYGNPVKVYNAERCICDLLKNKNEVDIELYNKIIKNYFKQSKKDLMTLEEYAKIFNIQEKFENIMEVLI